MCFHSYYQLFVADMAVICSQCISLFPHFVSWLYYAKILCFNAETLVPCQIRKFYSWCMFDYTSTFWPLLVLSGSSSKRWFFLLYNTVCDNERFLIQAFSACHQLVGSNKCCNFFCIELITAIIWKQMMFSKESQEETK